jgi:hypothetical protein
MDILSYIKRFIWYLPGILTGAVLGFVYWYFWGCEGGCSISSSPVNSMLYGATMGALTRNLWKADRQ